MENECEKEVIIIVDKDDNVIAYKKRGDLDSKKDIYRVTGLWLTNSKKEILFVQRSFNDAMDKTVNEAKGEVEAFTLNRILSFGIKGIEESLANTKGFKLLDGADDYSEDKNV